jgi:hypothetical protein
MSLEIPSSGWRLRQRMRATKTPKTRRAHTARNTGALLARIIE